MKDIEMGSRVSKVCPGGYKQCGLVTSYWFAVGKCCLMAKVRWYFDKSTTIEKVSDLEVMK
jgi:hypothetical protein